MGKRKYTFRLIKLAPFHIWFFYFFFSGTVICQPLGRYEYSAQKMGTTFRIIMYSNDPQTADLASAAAFFRVDELNSIFSVFETDSEINRISAKSGSEAWQPVSDDMWKVLICAREISILSNGAFDITIGPLSKLWRQAIRKNDLPAEKRILEAKNLVDYHWLEFREKDKKIRLLKKGMQLDAGGIAKGYTVDEVYKVLQEFDIDIALVDGGGDIYVGEAPPGNTEWNLDFVMTKIQKDGKTANELQPVYMAFASSGDTYRHIVHHGKKYSHIIDPRTGYGVAEKPVITVAAINCTLADAWASTLSVLELEEGKALIDKMGSCLRYLTIADN